MPLDLHSSPSILAIARARSRRLHVADWALLAMVVPAFSVLAV